MRRLVAVLAGCALLASGCGSAGEPPNLAPNITAERPMPAGAEVVEEVNGPGGRQVDCGDPTASLEPDGLNVPSGSTMAEIRDRGYLIAGVDQNTFLFGFRNPTNGDLEGFDIEIARQIAQELLGDASKIQFRAITSQQRIPVLEEGKVDIVVRTMTVNCERREQIQFSSVYFEAHQDILVGKHSGYAKPEDLADERICATHGSTSLRRIADWGAVPVGVDNWSDCLVLMQQGDVEAVSTDNSILAGMAQQDPTLEVMGEKLAAEPYAIGIPVEHEDMVRYVNAVLENVRDGNWQSIYDRWLRPVLGRGEPPKPTYE